MKKHNECSIIGTCSQYKAGECKYHKRMPKNEIHYTCSHDNEYLECTCEEAIEEATTALIKDSELYQQLESDKKELVELIKRIKRIDKNNNECLLLNVLCFDENKCVKCMLHHLELSDHLKKEILGE